MGVSSKGVGRELRAVLVLVDDAVPLRPRTVSQDPAHACVRVYEGDNRAGWLSRHVQAGVSFAAAQGWGVWRGARV